MEGRSGMFCSGARLNVRLDMRLAAPPRVGRRPRTVKFRLAARLPRYVVRSLASRRVEGRALADGAGTTVGLYFVWLVAFVAACALCLSALWCWLCRRGRVSRVTWALWTVASLVPLALCFSDAGRRLDIALSQPVALAAKAVLIALVLATAVWLALRRSRAAQHASTARRLSWQLLLANTVAAAWAAFCFHEAVGPGPPGTPTLPPFVRWVRALDTQGVTDLGTFLNLIVPDNPEDFQPIPLSALFGDHFRERLIETGAPDGRSDCHGWIFTGGTYGVGGDAVRLILLDNGYDQVQQPRPGDLVVYRQPDGTMAHSGIVRLAEEDLILVESEWGPQARYLHRLMDQPYATRYEFYRSPREGHRIRLVLAEAGL